jgi:AcrR family transcriptional regulator
MENKGQRTREEIIRCATEHFYRKGIYQVTYQAIAADVGLTQPALYRYFKNMDALFLECCKHWDAKAREVIYTDNKRMVSAITQIANYVRDHFEYSKKNRSHDGLMLGLYFYSMHSKEMKAYYQETLERSLGNLDRILQFGNMDGSWKISKTLVLSSTIHSLIAGEIFKFLISPQEEEHGTKIKRITNAITSLIEAASG